MFFQLNYNYAYLLQKRGAATTDSNTGYLLERMAHDDWRGLKDVLDFEYSTQN